MLEVNQDTIKWIMDNPKESGALLKTSLKCFISVFHYYIFRRQFIFKPFHDEIIQKLEDIVFDRAEKRNLYIGVCPRSGKSQIMQYFICWSYAINKACNFIMTSYGDKLVLKFSGQSKAIIESELFTKLFNLRCVKDTTAKDLWKIEGGGEFRASSLQGTLTGFGCFEYNQVVLTDEGEKKIGDIVEKEQKINVYSYNVKKDIIEKKPINFYIKNKNQTMIRVIFNDGCSVLCTPDHKIYTNKGWVRADKLLDGDFILPSNSSNNIIRNFYPFAYFFIGMIFISDIFRFFFAKNLFSWARIVYSSLKSYSLRFSSPINSAFNIGYIISRKIKIRSYKFIRSFIHSNFSSNIWRYFAVPIMRSVFNTIFFVVRLSPISKIFNRIIHTISIKMSNAKTFLLFAYKCMCKKLMKSAFMSFPIRSKVNAFISFFIDIKRKYMSRPVVFNFTRTSDRIKPFVFRDRKPLFIYCVGHNFNSYCLNISSNHNFFLGGCQQVLVKNCGVAESEFGGALIIDDFLKADNFKSATEKQNVIDIYTNTLKSRLNNPNTPIVIIAQRLAKDDLIGWIQENEAEDWDFLIIPTLNENDESIWEDKFPAQKMIKMREMNPFLFYSQYQQEPIVLGGTVIKEEWFRFYPTYQNTRFTRLYITADTAMKVKEANDYTAIGLWGLTDKNDLYLIDLLHGKWEAPDLERQFIAFWNKWRNGINYCKPNGAYIEDKASGTGLIQSVKHKGMPVIPIKPDKDKLTRAMDVTPYIESGLLYLPMNKEYDISKKVINECVAFTADDSHKNDDICDCLFYALEVAYRKQPLKVASGWDEASEAINDYY